MVASKEFDQPRSHIGWKIKNRNKPPGKCKRKKKRGVHT